MSNNNFLEFTGVNLLRKFALDTHQRLAKDTSH